MSKNSKRSSQKPKRIPSWKALATTLAWFTVTSLLATWITMGYHFGWGVFSALVFAMFVGIPMCGADSKRLRRGIFYMIGLLVIFAFSLTWKYSFFAIPQFYSGERTPSLDRSIKRTGYDKRKRRRTTITTYYQCGINEAGPVWFKNDPVKAQDLNSEQFISGFFIPAMKSEQRVFRNSFEAEPNPNAKVGYLFTKEKADSELRKQHLILYGVMFIWFLLFYFDEFNVGSSKPSRARRKR